MTRAIPSAALLLLALTGCGTIPAVPNLATDPVADLTAAIDLYGIAKGIAEQGETADPSLMPPVTAAAAIGDAALATAQTLLSGGAVDRDMAGSLVKLLKVQAQSLMLTGAPAVTVVPNQAAAS